MAWFKRKEVNIQTNSPKQDVPDGMWIKCPECGEMMHKKQWEANTFLCIKCGHHFRIGSSEYINILLDEDSFSEFDRKMRSVDPLLAKRDEELGFAYLAFPDHIVIPRTIDSRYPYNESGP